MNIEFRPASEVDLKAYIQAFNHAYQGYYVPIILNTRSFTALIKRDAIDLTASVAALDGNEIVGISMLAIRRPRGWIGGVGVIPDYRRRGIAQQMMHYLIDQARQRELEEVYLEVIQANTGAYDLYQKLDFETLRRLLILERPSGDVAPVEGYQVTPYRPEQALANYYDRFHDVENPWQRSRPALHDLSPNLEGWMIAAESDLDTVLGYAMGWVGPQSLHFMDTATSPSHPARECVTRALLAHIHHETPGASGHVVNLGEDDAITPVLLDLGYEEQMAQYEMCLKL